MKRAHFALVTALLFSAALGGCTLLKLRDQAATFYASTVIVGRVSTQQDSSPIVVAALAMNGSKHHLVHRVWLHEPGGYELIVPNGRYRVAAFGDENRNSVWDATEPFGMSSEIVVNDERLIPLVDLQLSLDEPIEALSTLTASAPEGLHSQQVGFIADLARDEFSAAAGSAGYWLPMAAFRQFGGNIYFLEPFDAKRTPVLFVHGALGSAQDFRALYRSLDRTKFQAWIFQYPSGAALESMSHLLYWKLLNLRVRHRFDRLHIVAHSMGGLIVRRFLLDHGHEFDEIDQFVSISTPWNGEPRATLGVEHSPAVVPSWRDMQPNGPFLSALFARALPTHVTHTLLFGHRGGYSLLRPTSDGAVTLASQLRPEAQSGARLVMGFDEDHVSVLSSRSVIDQVARTLEAHSSNTSEHAGRLALELCIEGIDLSERFALLVLRPLETGTEAREITLSVSARSQQTLALLPLGLYEVHIAVPGYRSSPVKQRVRLEAHSAAVVQTTLEAQGVLTGRVVLDSSDFSRPAGTRGTAAEIMRIVLQGAGETRVLERHANTTDLTQAYLEQRDGLNGNAFAFVRLSEGEYTLTVTLADGATHVSRHRVVPGHVPPEIPIVMRTAPRTVRKR